MVARLRALDDEYGPLDDDSNAALILVGVAHDTRDRTVWGGDRAITYWSRLPEKVRAACYAGPHVADWWERAVRLLGCSQPSRQEDRAAVAQIIGQDQPGVLRVLRTNPEALCLRVRLAIQHHKESSQ
jgi:hypothetical protein